MPSDGSIRLTIALIAQKGGFSEQQRLEMLNDLHNDGLADDSIQKLSPNLLVPVRDAGDVD